MSEAIYYVYAYYEPGKAEPFYIGKGKGNRAWEHLFRSEMEKKTPFHSKLKSMIADGSTPEIEMKAEGLFDGEAVSLERHLIRQYGRCDLGRGPLLNITDGGDGLSGFHHSKETIAKIRETHLRNPRVFTEENRRRIREAAIRKWTPEMREAARLRRLGKHYTKDILPGPKARAIVGKQNGEIRYSFTSVKSAKKNGYHPSHAIYNGCLYLGCTWEYVDG